MNLMTIIMASTLVTTLFSSVSSTGIDGFQTNSNTANGQEYFTSHFVEPFDSDGDGMDDSARIQYSVATTTIWEDVRVEIHVRDGQNQLVKSFSNSFRVVHNNRIGGAEFVEFSAPYTSNYNISYTLIDETREQIEDTTSDNNINLVVSSKGYRIFLNIRVYDGGGPGNWQNDVDIHVYDNYNYSLGGVDVYMDGDFLGQTNARGHILDYNLPRGFHEVDAFYGRIHVNDDFFADGPIIADSMFADADPLDLDEDGLKDDVEIRSYGPNLDPFPLVRVYIDGNQVGVTDFQGRITVFDQVRGWHNVLLTRGTMSATTVFFAEGVNVTNIDEYIVYVSPYVVDADNGTYRNDIDTLFDVDVEGTHTSNITLKAFIYYEINGSLATEVEDNYTFTGMQFDEEHLMAYDLDYDSYDIRYELWDGYGNLEDVRWWFGLDIVNSTGNVNVEQIVLINGQNGQDDCMFWAHITNFAEPDVKIKVFWETNDTLARMGYTDQDGYLFFNFLPNGNYYWDAYDDSQNIIEHGRFFIYQALTNTLQTYDFLTDDDNDGFFDDFFVAAYTDGVGTMQEPFVNIWVWDSNGNFFTSTSTGSSAPTNQLVIENIPKGWYNYTLSYIAPPLTNIWLKNGTFYSYGNSSEVNERLNVFSQVLDLNNDPEGNKNDVVVTVKNRNGAPVPGALVFYDQNWQFYDVTNSQGQATEFDFEIGWHEVDAYTVVTPRHGYGRFFSEGVGVQYTLYAFAKVNDEDVDNQYNDINTTIDVFADQYVASVVKVVGEAKYVSNDTLASTNEVIFQLNEWGWRETYLNLYNLPYFETYNLSYILYDDEDNIEDYFNISGIEIVPINASNINIDIFIDIYEFGPPIPELEGYSTFYARYKNTFIDSISITIYPMGSQVPYSSGYTNEDGYYSAIFPQEGSYHFVCRDWENKLVEYGEMRIDFNITYLWNWVEHAENDDLFDDFIIYALDDGYNAIDTQVTIMAENNTIIASGSTTDYPFIASDLPMGHYSYYINATSGKLQNGTLFSYGNGTPPPPQTPQAPVPVIDSPVSTIYYNDTIPIYFDGANSSDPNNDPISYYWTSNLTGGLSTSSQFSMLLQGGTHRITLYVDDGGFNTSAYVDIIVNSSGPPPPPNHAPHVDAGNDATIQIDTMHQLDGSGSSDPDTGDSIAAYLWEVTSSHTSGVDYTLTDANKGWANFTAHVEGAFTIKLTVWDTHGLSNDTSITITAVSNREPVVMIELPMMDAEFFTSDTIFFDANGTYDPDDDWTGDGVIGENETDNLTYTWHWWANDTYNGEIKSGNSDAAYEFNDTLSFGGGFLEEGMYSINLSVTDGFFTMNTSVHVNLTNTPPYGVNITSPTNMSVHYASQIISFTCVFTDPDDNDLTITWTDSIDNGSATVFRSGPSGSTSSFTSKMEMGYHTVTVYVDDGRTDHNISATRNFVVYNTPPIASMGSIPDSVNIVDTYTHDLVLGVTHERDNPTVEFDASGSSDPDGDVITFLWDFGDGDTSTEAVTNHTYDSQSQEPYIIVLTVTDENDAETQATKEDFTVNAPPAIQDFDMRLDGEKLNADEVPSGETITFEAMALDNLPEGGTLTYEWKFGNTSTGIGTSPTYKFSNPGIYSVQLTCSDELDAATLIKKDIQVVQGNMIPLAFIGSERKVNITQEIAFNGSWCFDPDDDTNGNNVIDGDEVNNLVYKWEFGDGSISSEVSPTHSWDEAGEYEIRITVTDPSDATATDAVNITVNTPPVAAFTADPDRDIIEGDEITFDASDSLDEDEDDNLTYVWDFGDSNTDNGMETTHTYSTFGDYIVELNVSDGWAWDTETMIITVGPGTVGPAPTIVFSIDGQKTALGYHGTVYVNGSATGQSLSKVQLRIDGPAGKTGSWTDVSDHSGNTTDWTWSYMVNTRAYTNGNYKIYVRSYDNNGQYSQELSQDITIYNEPVTPSDGGDDEVADETLIDKIMNNRTYQLAIVIGLIVILLIIILVVRSRKKKPAAVAEVEDAGDEELAEVVVADTEEGEAKKVVTKLPVKCPKCEEAFTISDDGSRPIRLECPSCGAKGLIKDIPTTKDGDGMEEELTKEEKELFGPTQVSVLCPECSTKFKVDADSTEIKCPSCGITGSREPTKMKPLEKKEEKVEEKKQKTVKCPQCTHRFKVDADAKEILCPKCGLKGKKG